MRKAQKQRIEEFLIVLEQAHNEIKRLNEKRNFSRAMEVLEQCQQGAVQLGGMIESIEGEACATIRLLEDYCEAVYQFYDELRQKFLSQREDAQQIGCIKCALENSKKLSKHFRRIKNSVKNDIRIRKEIVFLPYKASMWDSLESVWQAADAEPDCDAYVIPIPYYDRGIDGSFREMHYEGELYPEYVPVVRYDEYDFEKRKPDMIFIHNPYDEYNYVTSVAPFFYSKNLKKYTEKLIYIPYFLLGEINPDDPAALEGIAHFCTTQGVVNADKVIVQSEDMRQAYINVLTKETGEGSRKYWEEKILGLGSPKIDKVLNTKKENLDIPVEWLKILKKPDGKFKKVIFYNTGVTALLKNEDRLLKKIRDVMKVFRENKEEVVLLWRPHPLMRSTLESMRPQLLRQYEEIVERYREEGWGIYDDTADMDRAVALSDGYYGDWSSIVWLYQTIGKPIILENVSILSEKEIPLNCAEIIRDKEKIFFLTRDTKSIFEYNTVTGEMKLCGVVGNKITQKFLSMALYENKLYTISCDADVICIYDIEKESFQNIFLSKTYNRETSACYHMCFSYQYKIYFLGDKGRSILYLDTRDNTIKHVREWVSVFEEKYGYEPIIYTQANICIQEDCFWIALEGKNIIFQYNMITEKYRFWNIGSRKMQYSTVSFDGKYFWFSGDKKCIVRWEKETNEIREFEDFPSGFKINKNSNWKDLFYCGYIWNGSIYFAPLSSNMLIKFNLKFEKMVKIVQIDLNHICLNIIGLSENELYIEEDNIDTFTIESGYLIEKNGECCRKPMTAGKTENIKYISECEKMEMKNYIIENHPQCMKAFQRIWKEKEQEDIKEFKNYVWNSLIAR